MNLQEILFRDIEGLKFTYLERNPDDSNEFIRTYWYGDEAKSRLNSLMNYEIQQHDEELIEILQQSKDPDSDFDALSYNAVLDKIIALIKSRQSGEEVR